MDLLKKAFGARIKEIRIKNNLNQEQLAELINMESRQLRRIETGSSFTSLDNIKKIADALNVEVSDLFSFNHKRDKEILISEINSYLKTATNEQIELVYKFFQIIFK